MCRFSAGLLLLMCLFLPRFAFCQPVSLTASMGMPANGDAHYITLTWVKVQGASSYELQSSTNGNSWDAVYTGADSLYSHNSGNAGNMPYYYRVRSVQNGVSSGWRNATQYPFYSACDFPALPSLSSPDFFRMSLSLMPDGNPAYTTYSIYCPTESKYLQPDGTLGATEVFQTMFTWGVVTITGLEHSTDYCFYAKAKNSDGDIRMGSQAFMNPELFTTNANFNQSTGALFTKFWSPAACQTGGLEFKSTGGCADGYIGYRKSFNNKFDCWLRTPEVNCSGSTSAVLKFDLSNTYFADHPNDRIRFYLWDNTYASGLHYYYATSVKINGVEKGVTDANGIWLYFDEARECTTVEVTFDFAALGLPNTDKLLFYMHPKCDYHDARMFHVKLDNISVQRSISSACLATANCSAAAIESHPQSQNGCLNGNTSFGVSTSGNIDTYQWQVSTNNGNTWANVTNDWLYSNATTSTLTITGVLSNMNGYYYRCLMSPICSAPLTSNSAMLQTIQHGPGAAGTITGNTSVCQGQNGIAYSIPTVSGADSYSWSLPSGATITTGEGTNSIIVNFGAEAVSGNVVAIPMSACGQGNASPAFNVTVNVLPITPSEIVGATSICGSKNLTYSVPLVNGATYYTWLLPGGWAGTSLSETMHATTNGFGGTILVTANAACGSSAARALTIIGGVGPGIPDVINGNSDVCPGDSFTLSITPVMGADSYIWTLPSGWSGSSSSPFIDISPGESGGTVYVSAHNDCGTSAPQAKTLSIKQPPTVLFDYSLAKICTDEAPRAFATGFPPGGAYSGDGVSFGILFPANATPGIHVITYEYTDANGCTASDTALTWIEICSGISTAPHNTFEVYPNPFKETLVIKFKDITDTKTVLLYNAIGKEIREIPVPVFASELKIEVPPSTASGIIFLKIVSASGNASEIKKVVRIQ